LVALLFGVLGAWAVGARRLDSGWVWTKKTGWYNPARAVRSTASELLEQSNEAQRSEQYADSAYGYSLLIDTYPSAPEVEPALLQLIEARFQLREYDAALAAIDRLLARKPSTEITTQILQRKYEIALGLLTGDFRRGWLGLAFSSQDYAVELLDKLVEAFPFQSFSDDALYHIGNYYFRAERYEEAELVYQRLIKDYPKSDWAANAEYQLGAAALKRLKGVDYDFAPVDEAEKRFFRYLAIHQTGDRVKAAREGLAEISRLRAERLYKSAQHYLRRGEVKAVRYYLQKLLREHSETPVAISARRLLKRTGGGSDEE
jgi:outer membrane protein assembly factor BamD (BamD/ComL family)